MMDRFLQSVKLHFANLCVSPLYTLLVCAPGLLPDFYTWKTYLHPEDHQILNILWLIGVLLKYVALVLAVIALLLVRRDSYLQVILAFAFFGWAFITSIVNGRGVHDVWNLFLWCAPPFLYLPTVVTRNSTKRQDCHILMSLLVVGTTIGGITVWLFMLLPRGFGELFGACASYASGRTCYNFIGIHADLSLYGICLIAMAILVYLLTFRLLMLIVPAVIATCLLLFSGSATSKVLVVIMLLGFSSIVFLLKNPRMTVLVARMGAFGLQNSVLAILSLLMPLLLTAPQVAVFMQKVLHRDATMTGRLSLYQTAISEFYSSPLWGNGYSDSYFKSVLKNNMGETMSVPHNSYLQLLMSGGLVWLLLFIMLCNSVYTHRISDLRQQDRLVIISANTLFLAACLASFTFRDFFTVRFFLLLGLLYCISVVLQKNSSALKTNDESVMSGMPGSSERRKNVLLFMSKLDMGGIETLFLNVIPRLSNQYNFFITYYGDGDNELGDKFEECGCHLHRMTEHRYRHPIRFIRETQGYIKDNDIDVVHVNVGYSTFFGLAAARFSNVPIRIAHSHNGAYGIRGNPLNCLFSILCKIACHYWATERVNISRTSARALFFKRDSSVLIPNGIDLSRFAFDSQARKSIREQLGIADDDLMILHIGRFARQKNHEFLVQVFAEYHQINPHSYLVLLGDGELQEIIRSQVHDLGLDDAVMFMGLQTEPERYYSAADCFLFPSLYEGLGIVLVEAEANGLQCLVSDTVDLEVKLVEYAEFISLNAGPAQWAQHIPLRPGLRFEVQDDLRLKQYDINMTVALFRQLYRGELCGRYREGNDD